MSEALKKFLSNYVALSNEELDDIVHRFKRKRLNKHEYLLREGMVCKNIVFVETGCLRLYYLKEAIEVSVWFSFAHSSAIEISSFISGKPTQYFLQAIEDSEVLVLPKSELNTLYKEQPKMQEMMRVFLEDVVLNLIDRFTALQRDDAEKRYKDLLDKPGYMQQVPQKYLASFIGVTPTSLSRIKRKIG